MPLTRDFRQSVVERVHRDPAFAMALLDKAATLFLNGEPQTARLILRDLVNATVGFEGLAAATDKPAKSLHRMLSPKGNPSMDNLAAIFCAVRKNLGWISRLTRSKQREVDEESFPVCQDFRRLLCAAVVASAALGTANYSYADEMVQVAAHRTDLSLTPSSKPLMGYLARPDGAGRHPAMVELHGCNGFGTWDSLTATVLKHLGYVGLALDSLENRDACGSGPFGATAEAFDAYSAIDWLARQSFVDPDRIAVLGFSMGGSAALMAIERGLIEQFHPWHFAAAIAYYPRCHERTGVMTASTLILIGAEDDRTLGSWCQDMITRRAGQGASVTLTVYPGATHAFNLPYPPRRYLGHRLQYDPAAAADAWQRVRGFLHSTLQFTQPSSIPAAGVR